MGRCMGQPLEIEGLEQKLELLELERERELEQTDLLRLRRMLGRPLVQRSRR